MKSAISSVEHAIRKNGHERHISRCSSRSPSSSALPAPNHDGSRIRFCVHANTHGIARRSSSRPPLRREAGREPIVSSASSSTGETWRKKRTKSSLPTSSR